MLINRTSLSAAFTGFNTIFNQAFAGAASVYGKIVMEVPSTTTSEEYAWLGSSTGFREWVGDRVLQNLATHDFSIRNKTFENTIAVKREHIEDDKLGVYRPVIQQLGQDAKTHPDKLLFALIKAGFTGLCYDGQYFFDTDHPVGGDSVSNYQAGTGTPWYLLDLSRAQRPFILQKRRDYTFTAMDAITDEAVFSQGVFRYGVDCRLNVGYGLWQLAYASKADLTADNLNAAIAAMSSVKADNGDPLGVKPTHLLVPPALRAQALTLVKAETVGGTTNINRDLVEVLDTAWLA